MSELRPGEVEFVKELTLERVRQGSVPEVAVEEALRSLKVLRKGIKDEQ